MAATCKVWVCRRLLAGFAGLDVVSLLSGVCCQVESLRRADHSSRGVLPSAVCLSEMVKPRCRGGPGPCGGGGL